MGTKWESREKRVGDIVGAAVEIFLEKGYEGASMEAIARKAGISKGGLYHHFGGKDEILFYANEKLSEPVYGFIRSALENPDAVEGLKSYIENYIRYWTSHPKEVAFFFLTMTKALERPDTWQFYEEYYNKLEGFITGLFEKGIREGKLAGHNVKAGSTALLSALDGVLAYLVMNKGLDMEEVISSFREKFVTGLQTDTHC